MIKTKTLRKLQIACIVLLMAVSILFATSLLQDSSQKKVESSVYLEGIKEIDSASDKITDETKAEVKKALYDAASAENPVEAASKLKIDVIVLASGDLSDEAQSIGAKLENKVSLDKKSDYVQVEMNADDIARIASSNDVVKIYPNLKYYALLDNSVPLINAPSFWKSGYTGQGVKVAVLDTGIRKTHEMLAGKIIAERDFSDSGSADDVHGHGTHVAGTIAGTNASGGRFNGVAPGALLLNAKVLNDTGYGDTMSIISGISWAVDNGANVISMSLGSGSNMDAAMETVIEDSVSKGVIFVVSSGNCGSGCPSDTCNSFRGVEMPGSSPSVITVGAVDDDKNIACFSSGGNVPGVGIKPDFVAPGVDIESSVPSGYGSKSGTSMATPHVSGAVALILSRNMSLNQGDIKSILEKTSLDLGTPGKDTSYGFGLIDLDKALYFSENLDFSVNISKLVNRSDTVPISVVVYDLVQIENISSLVTRPDGEKSAILLTGEGNLFNSIYSDTQEIGRYQIELEISYLSSSGSTLKKAFYSGYFDVMGIQGDFISVNGFTFNYSGGNISGSISLESSSDDPLNLSLSLQMSKGPVIKDVRLGNYEVSKGSSQLFFTSPASIEPGSYNATLIGDFGQGTFAFHSSIDINDSEAPLIYGIEAKPYVSEVGPEVVFFDARESSDLVLNLSVSRLSANGSEEVQVISSKREREFDDGSKNEFVTIYGLFEPGDYSAEFTPCDSSGNCAEKFFVNFTATKCRDGPRLLFIHSSEKGSGIESEISQRDLCASVIDTSESDFVPLSYAMNFDALVWSSGNDISGLNQNFTDLISRFYIQKGVIAVEGSEIANEHVNDRFMTDTLHSRLDSDLRFSAEDFSGNTSIRVLKIHPLTIGLPDILEFNSSLDKFPDSILPIGSESLALWNSTLKTSMVLFENSSSKSTFISFDMDAVDNASRAILAKNMIDWALLEDDQDILPGNITLDSQFEGLARGTLYVESIRPLQDKLKVGIQIDNESVIDAASIGPFNEYSFSTLMEPGQHRIRAIVNSNFSYKEKNYFNDKKEYNLTIYPEKPDFAIQGFGYEYDDTAGSLVTSVNVSNLGGESAFANIKTTVNGSQDIQQLQLNPLETRTVTSRFNFTKSIFQASIIADPENIVDEFNESNNRLDAVIYVCSKSPALIIQQDDSELYSTAEPDSLDKISYVLVNKGYCTESWSIKAQGIPDYDYMKNFRLITWTSGSYFNQKDNNELLQALENFSGGVLIEGDDMGLANSNNMIFSSMTGSALAGDMILNASSYITLINNTITSGLASQLILDNQFSPYPDAISPVESESIAQWPSNESAIVVTTRRNGDISQKVVYFGFNVNGITDSQSRNLLIANSVSWLLSNSPPKLEPIANVTVNETDQAIIIANASDADGDVLYYYINDTRFAQPYNGTFVWHTGYGDAGNYTVNLSVSDGKVIISQLVLLVIEPKLAINSAPIIESLLPNGTVAVNEGYSVNFSVDASDPDNDSLNYIWLLNLKIVSTGSSFNYSPGYDESGQYLLKVIVNDSTDAVYETVNVTVINVNRVLVLKKISNITIFENETISIIAQATDEDNDELTYFYAYPLNESGKWKANFSTSGDYYLNLTVSDGQDNVSQSFNLTVLNVNREPKFYLVEPSVFDEGDELYFHAYTTKVTKNGESDEIGNNNPGCSGSSNYVHGCVYFYDLDNENYVTNDDNNLTFKLGPPFDDEQKWNLSYSDAGNQTIIVNFSDGIVNKSVNFTLTVLNTNRPPVINLSDNLTLNEGELFSFRIPAYDLDNDTLVFSSDNLPAGAQLDSIGLFVWSPNPSQAGAYLMNVTVTDGFVYVTKEIILSVLHVNTPPLISVDGPIYIYEGATAIFKVNVSDPENDNISLFANDSRLVGNNGEFDWKPLAGDAGNYDFEFTASDGKNSSTAKFTLVVLRNASLYGPVITILSPLQDSIITRQSAWLNVSTDANSTCSYEQKICIDGGGCDVNQVLMESINKTFHYSFMDLSVKGKYEIGVLCNSSLLSSRANVSFTVAEPVMLNGLWHYDDNSYVPIISGYGGHPLVVIPGTNISDGVVSVDVALPAENTEAGLCFRMNNSGSGYCLSTAWGGGVSAMLSRFDGFPYNPSHIKSAQINISSSVPVTIKVMVNGNVIRGKVFNKGSDEPDWQIGATDTAFRSGQVGFYSYYSMPRFTNLTTSFNTTEPGSEMNGTVATSINGYWRAKGTSAIAEDFGYGGHPILVLDWLPVENSTITTEVSLPGENAEVGVCGRMNLSGYGYCLSTAWGGQKRLALSYFSGFPYNPGILTLIPLTINSNETIILKMQIQGSIIRGKAYNINDAEPGWQITSTDNKFTKGYAAYYTYYSSASFNNTLAQNQTS
ncbi:S8 family serine peptidase [Candidatus Woesearchaeota archaeon]|nr:S8 family serine peptidase [Candidatus Woesearchaeota archaeon]